MKLLKNFVLILVGCGIAPSVFAKDADSRMKSIQYVCEKSKCFLNIEFSSEGFPRYAKKKSQLPNDLSLVFENTSFPVPLGEYALSLNEKDSLKVSLAQFSQENKRTLLNVKLPSFCGKVLSEVVLKNTYKIEIENLNKKSQGRWTLNSSHQLKKEEPKVVQTQDVKAPPKMTLSEFYDQADKSSQNTSKTFMIEGKGRMVVVINEKASVFDKIEKSKLEIFALKFGDSVLAVNRSGEFYQVKLSNGQTGFVSPKNVRFLSDLSKTQIAKLKKVTSELAQNKGVGKDVSKSGKDNKDTLSTQAKEVIKRFKEQVLYSTYGKRDPFIPLDEPEINGVSIDDVQLVGIIWENKRPMAIVEDVRNLGVSYTLKENDPILNGRVFKITQQEVIFELNEFGVSRKYSMALPIEKQ